MPFWIGIRPSAWHLEGFTPAIARDAVKQTLHDWGIPAETVEDAILITSEIATNAIKHVRREWRSAAFVYAHLGIFGATLRIGIADPDPQPPRLIQAEFDDEQHRGLTIVDALAREWGSQPVAGNLGKIVWWTQAID